MGSIRTETGIPELIRSWAALRRFEGVGADGSRVSANRSFSVVIVKVTVAGSLASISESLVTKSLLVTI